MLLVNSDTCCEGVNTGCRKAAVVMLFKHIKQVLGEEVKYFIGTTNTVGKKKASFCTTVLLHFIFRNCAQKLAGFSQNTPATLTKHIHILPLTFASVVPVKLE